MGARDRLRRYFEEHLGKVVRKGELAKVAGIHEWARRVRELRDDEGMQIKSHNDRADLKPGEYVLEDLKRVPRVGRGIDGRLRTRILERNGFTCQICGAAANDPDPLDARRKVRLQVDHIDPNGPADETNLRTLCSACNEGRSNLTLPRSSINLLAAVRKASQEDQRRALEWLQRKFGVG
jgi:hypothetical protein